jgi:chromatin remodeling complex protein RSC6
MPSSKAAAPKTANTSVSSDTTTPVLVRMEQLQATVSLLTSQLRDVGRECSAIQKEYLKEKRAWERQVSKLKERVASRKAHGQGGGIAKPGYISKELCTFIGVDTNTKMARTEVIKYINTYIKENKLQDTKNRTIIVPDAKLGKLLRSDQITQDITYFNLQSFMKPHLSDPNKGTGVEVPVAFSA